MTSSDLTDNAICRDLSGPLTLEREPDGTQCYVKTIAPAAATPDYRQEVQRLQQGAGQYVVPLLGGTNTRLSFAYEGWEPLSTWRKNLDNEKFFPLERALRMAIDFCTALQEIRTNVAGGFEVHSGVVLVSKARTPPCCRLLLWPIVKNVRPADYLRCSPEVLLCTPPEAFCGQYSVQPEIYAAGVMLRLIFTEVPLPNQSAPELIEQLVGEGLPAISIAPERLPQGMNYALRSEWEKLTMLVARATAHHPSARDVTLDSLIDAFQTILDRLDYYELAERLCEQGRYEEACDVCRYGAWAKFRDNQEDIFWRQALKRQCGKIYMNYLHKYYEAAAIFYDYLTNEVTQDPSVVAQVRESYGDALAALGPHDMALEQYERALPDIPDRARLYLKIADAYRRHRDYPKAIETLQRQLNSNPNHLEALQDIAEIYLQQDDTQSAHSSAVRALHVLKNQQRRGIIDAYSSNSILADIHAILGMCLVHQSEYQDAQILANQALSEDSNCYRAYNVFGLMYIHQGDMVRAMRSFGISLRLKPDQPEIQQWLEQSLGKKKG